ncbi:cytochrome P450 CYP82D47-like [Macadamia integrifolia]|uniref:cytochrome P450 CYP82D47-like n=1 Tax=Macadamia integrifolia TaxID=60698 RepID=UPI001C4F6736|nr:cytochrome P450 CYP82D47-like [Macadamia integrifolia]
MVKHVRASEIEAFIKELYKKWEEKEGGQNKQVLVDMKKWFADLTLNIIVRMVAGKRYFANKASDAEELKEWLKEHQQKRSSADYCKAKGDDQDFMDIMISIMEDSKLKDYDADTIIKATCLILFLVNFLEAQVKRLMTANSRTSKKVRLLLIKKKKMIN